MAYPIGSARAMEGGMGPKAKQAQEAGGVRAGLYPRPSRGNPPVGQGRALGVPGRIVPPTSYDALYVHASASLDEKNPARRT